MPSRVAVEEVSVVDSVETKAPVEAGDETSIPITPIDSAKRRSSRRVRQIASESKCANATTSTSTGTPTKKRRVTPTTDQRSKKKQQQKASQLTLGSFFTVKKPTAPSKTVKFKPRQQPKTMVPESSPRTSSSESEQPSAAQVTDEINSEVTDDKTATVESLPIEPSDDSKNTENEVESMKTDQSTEVANEVESTEVKSEQKNDVVGNDTDSENDDEDVSTENVVAVKSDDSETPQEERKEIKKEDTVEQTQEKEEKDPFHGLSEENKIELQKYVDLQTRYSKRASELVSGATEGIDEEDFEMPKPEVLAIDDSSDTDFPDKVVANMVLLIEGSSLPLSKLVSKIGDELENCHSKKWTEASINAKIKLLAKRKACISKGATSNHVDIFEDEDPERLWRWEILIIDILPSIVLPKVRKARTARKKLASHHGATLRLLQTLVDAIEEIGSSKRLKVDIKLLARLSRDEEKVLKFEREAEKQRLALQAKKMKLQELESKRLEREQLAEERRKEKERKKQEAELKKIELEKKKQEAVQAREDAKKKKLEEREKKEVEKKQEELQKKQKLNKQKACLMSFFGASQKQESVPKSASTVALSEKTAKPSSNKIEAKSESFDSSDFWSKVDSVETHCNGRELFGDLSARAVESRKRKTRNVAVSVYVTVMPEGGAFGVQPFAENKVINIPNKYRFLGFHEDCRPAYFGTWSKKSSIITGRSPFKKDATTLNYDYDSEAEWEEGDDEVGEDVDDEAKNEEEDMEDEEGDFRKYNYEDGFCVADEQYLDIDENVDEETKALYKKKLQTGHNGDDQAPLANRVCILAPSFGGIPLERNCAEGHLEGFREEDGFDLLESHQCEDLMNVDLCLDAFQPVFADETEAVKDTTQSTSGKDEYSNEELALLAKFAHHCPLNSKEKLIEELRVLHPSVFVSRAKATRKLDSIAVKKKRTDGAGVYWEVKRNVLENLGLKELLEMKIEGVKDEKSPKKQESKKSSGKKKVSAKAKPKGKGKVTPSEKKTVKKRKKPEPVTEDEVDKNKQAKLDKKSTEKTEKEKKKPSPSMAASANLLASFLIRPKKKLKNSA